MAMSKRSLFTTITPLPASLTRQTVIDFFHDHKAMIDLNPLVIERHLTKAPQNASADEATCVWYSLTDKVHYLPGEPKEPMELGVTVPKEGLYIREDVDLRCNFILSGFVKKTLKKAHSVLVDRMLSLAERKEVDHALSAQFPMSGGSGNTTPMPRSSASSIGMPNNSNVSMVSNDTGIRAPMPGAGGPADPNMMMPGSTHSMYMGHPSQYPPNQMPPHMHPSMMNMDPRDPRMSYYSNAGSDPRMSYQSTQSNWSYGSNGQPQQAYLNPPGYQGYGYGGQPGYNNGSPGMAPNYYDDKQWDAQNGWYRPTMQPVEIASSEYIVPSDSKDTKGVEKKGDEKKKEEVGQKGSDAKTDEKKKQTADDKRFEAYPQPARANTFEMM
ncbi:hypothetical protein ABW20_dc0108473 [Dactylellina cionopaga]|nr:hypothetical protein ABW20_dc0108473 [Dactylellina cionopaga]